MLPTAVPERVRAMSEAELSRAALDAIVRIYQRAVTDDDAAVVTELRARMVGLAAVVDCAAGIPLQADGRCADKLGALKTAANMLRLRCIVGGA